MRRLRLLDAFCCEGGAGKGYKEAGFDVTGVDSKRQPRYPFEFIQADAVSYIAEHGHEYDVIHTSPPCQGYTIATAGVPEIRARHPRLIEPVRSVLRSLGVPYVIENVVGAPLEDPILLCGSMFGLSTVDDDGTLLRLQRHRLFESNIPLMAPEVHEHDRSVSVGGVYGGGRSDRYEAKHVRQGGYTPAKHVRAALIGADWMTLHGLSQSIPPAYTRYLGGQLRSHIEQAEGLR